MYPLSIPVEPKPSRLVPRDRSRWFRCPSLRRVPEEKWSTRRNDALGARTFPKSMAHPTRTDHSSLNIWIARRTRPGMFPRPSRSVAASRSCRRISVRWIPRHWFSSLLLCPLPLPRSVSTGKAIDFVLEPLRRRDSFVKSCDYYIFLCLPFNIVQLRVNANRVRNSFASLDSGSTRETGLGEAETGRLRATSPF